MIQLSRLISEFSGDLHAQYGGCLLPGHERAFTAMQACRTEHSPVLVVRCAACGQCETLPHSCGHRNCPHCQHHEGQQWLERQRAKLLPVSVSTIDDVVFCTVFEGYAEMRSASLLHEREEDEPQGPRGREGI